MAADQLIIFIQPDFVQSIGISPSVVKIKRKTLYLQQKTKIRTLILKVFYNTVYTIDCNSIAIDKFPKEALKQIIERVNGILTEYVVVDEFDISPCRLWGFMNNSNSLSSLEISTQLLREFTIRR